VIDRRLARVLGSALWMYDLTGGIRIGKRHHRISVDAAVGHMPTLARERLAGAYVYYDAQADDARLTLTIARTAAVHGAVLANYAALRGVIKDHDRVVGARVEADGEEIVVRTRVIVNAAGVWADDVRALDEGDHPPAREDGDEEREHSHEMGRVLERALPLVERFVDQTELALLEVAEPAVDELRALRTGPRGEVAAFHQRGAESPGRGVERDAGTGDATPDDQDVERFVAEPSQGPGTIEAAC
jgi:hypothetical protein